MDFVDCYDSKTQDYDERYRNKPMELGTAIKIWYSIFDEQKKNSNKTLSYRTKFNFFFSKWQTIWQWRECVFEYDYV